MAIEQTKERTRTGKKEIVVYIGRIFYFSRGELSPSFEGELRKTRQFSKSSSSCSTALSLACLVSCACCSCLWRTKSSSRCCLKRIVFPPSMLPPSDDRYIGCCCFERVEESSEGPGCGISSWDQTGCMSEGIIGILD